MKHEWMSILEYKFNNVDNILPTKNDWIRSDFVILSTQFYVIIKYQIQSSEWIPVGYNIMQTKYIDHISSIIYYQNDSAIIVAKNLLVKWTCGVRHHFVCV